MNAQRAAVVSAMRDRVEKHLTSTLSDADCVAVCIAAGFPRDRDDVFGVILNNSLCKAVSSRADSLAVLPEEWATLFGKESTFTKEAPLSRIVTDDKFKELIGSISDALRCSLTEAGAKAAWQRAPSRLSCYLALHTDCTEELVSHVLGGLVRADTRRLDDVRSTVEDEATDCMLLSMSVIALANCVV
jgi:hypothetical protein